MKKTVIILFILLSSLLASEINIAVAANVSYAIDELKTEFTKTHPDIKVRVTLGSSGKLTAQIKNGAPYGLFMSANMKYPEALYQDNIAITKPIIYAQGALAYLSSKKQDFSIGIKLLKSEKINKIAIANPKTAPYGKAALDAMKKSGIYEKVKSKLVYAQSISQTVTYSVTAADIGFIAKSALYSSRMQQYKKNINWIDVDASLYTPINQGIVLLKTKNNSVQYKVFYNFILSAKAKKILKRYGYLIKHNSF